VHCDGRPAGSIYSIILYIVCTAVRDEIRGEGGQNREKQGKIGRQTAKNEKRTAAASVSRTMSFGVEWNGMVSMVGHTHQAQHTIRIRDFSCYRL